MEFRKLVAEMREAQKKYFETRERFWLTRAKGLERSVDKELEKPTEKTLFDQ